LNALLSKPVAFNYMLLGSSNIKSDFDMIFLSSIIKYKFLKLKLIEVESHTFDFRGTSIVDHKAVNSLVVDTVRARHKVDHTVVLEGAITSIAREVAGNIKASL